VAENNALPDAVKRPPRRRRRRLSLQDLLEEGLNPWVTAAAAGRILQGVDVRAIAKLAGAGLIGVRDLPGVRARYSRSDVERLIAERIQPAKLDKPAV
jgi:hypothetical protein